MNVMFPSGKKKISCFDKSGTEATSGGVDRVDIGTSSNASAAAINSSGSAGGSCAAVMITGWWTMKDCMLDAGRFRDGGGESVSKSSKSVISGSLGEENEDADIQVETVMRSDEAHCGETPWRADRMLIAKGSYFCAAVLVIEGSAPEPNRECCEAAGI